MSKLKINKFINKNKIRLLSLGTVVIMSFSLPACTYNKPDTSKSANLNENQEDLKSYIVNNITNLEIFKSEQNKGYFIEEIIYNNEPIYNESGKIIDYDNSYAATNTIFLTFEETELFGITELLEARITFNQKTK